MNEISYVQNTLQLTQTIKSYWMYILGLILLITYGYFTKSKKTMKSLFKGG